MPKRAMAAPKAFRSLEHFREWLHRNHATEVELVLRCFKVHAKHRGIGYKEGLDEALCFGWIDGVRRSLDNDSFTVRFTPRRPKSKWSVVNIRRVKELEAEGRMRPPGLAAFQARGEIAQAPYSYENRGVRLDPSFEKRLRKDKRAWSFFQAQPPWYRRSLTFWVMSAKKEDTRERRFASVLERCAKEQVDPQLQRAK